ncbi:MAG: type II toxin-antitoxin system RelE/ParE family toxin [Bacteroidales bacterium]|nr:type II toxin-antitoxin system RelE/ParE family toxin [Candidatus Cryptobacteroides choladohippi]MCQ2178573.1 type II toxin-antitoxin system RelE/ParE family toxin [Bacteroidales bacterium]
MERKIRAYKNYFTDFISSISELEARKVFYVLDMLKMQERLSAKFVKHIEDGLFELRAEHGGNIFRVFFIFDEGNIVLLFNGFQKKSQKTPRKEIEQAKKLKNEYYAEKGK